MPIALSGTPGTGKTAVARALARDGFRVFALNDEAARAGLLTSRDRRRGSFEVDVAALDRAMRARLKGSGRGGPFVFEGHLAHLLTVERAVVLRCPPGLLARRLRRRGWSDRKVRENACAEAVGVIVTEAVDRLGRGRVYELETSGKAAGAVAAKVAAIARAGGKANRVGRIDYLEEASKWC